MSLPVQSAPITASAATGPVPAHKAISAKGKASDDAASATTTPGDGHFSFMDFLDIVNPLQHIPIVSSIYRELTGDTINPAARVVGGALFGGPIGAILGGINAVVASENNGKDIGELAMNKAGFGKGADEKETASTVQTATAKKDDKKIPIIEVHPSDAAALAQPIEKMPFARIAKSDIIWDKSVQNIQMASAEQALPHAKELNDLKPVAGFDPTFDDAAKDTAKDTNDAVAMNNVEPGTQPEEVVLDSATDAKLAAMAASTAQPPAAPIDDKQVPNQMLAALGKYQKMQDVGQEGLIAPKVGAVTASAADTANAALASAEPLKPTSKTVYIHGPDYKPLRHYGN